MRQHWLGTTPWGLDGPDVVKNANQSAVGVAEITTKAPIKLARSLHTVKVLAKLALIYLETDPSARHAVESVTLQLGYRRDTPDPDCIKAKAVALLVGMGFEP